MKSFLVIVISFGLIACGGNVANNDHSAHGNTAANASNTAAANVDHNAMGHGTSSDHSSMKSSPGASAAPYDLQFIDTMTAHHQGAVDMAMLAETRAQHQEVKDLAASIIGDQEREIAKMSEWRDRWFSEKPAALNMELPGMSHGMGGMDMKKLESLKGNDFDVEFLKQMIPHHEGAIDMAKDLQKQNSRAELKELASDIIKSQSAEIEQMQGWLKSWQSR